MTVRTDKTRVAMFVFNNGNHDQRVHKQAQALGREGYEVRVYCFLTPGLPYKEARDGYTLLREDQRSHTARLFDDKLMAKIKTPKSAKGPALPPSPAPPAPLSAPDDLPPTRPCAKPQRQLKAAASPQERDHWAYISRINRVWAERAESWNPHLVQAHDLDALEAATIVGRKLGVPVLYDTHELWSEQPFIDSVEAVDYWTGCEREFLKSVHAVMTINEPLAEILQRSYNLGPVTTLHNCQEVQDIPSAKQNRPPIALYQGAYVPHRGLEELIAAAGKLRHVRLAFRGFGPSENSLRALDAENKVLFWEPVPGPEVVQAAAQADIGLIPFLPTCLNHYYSTPNKLFEYMSAGLAIAGSDLPEISRFVNDLQIGCLFDPHSPSDIAESLDALAVSDQLEAMRERSRQAALDRWNWDIEIQKYLGLVKDLLNVSPKS